MKAVVAALSFIPFIPALTLAQAPEPYPSRTVTLVVNVAPGGGGDVLARLIGPKLAESMKQPFVVEPRPGASGQIGAEAAARSSSSIRLAVAALMLQRAPGLTPFAIYAIQERTATAQHPYALSRIFNVTKNQTITASFDRAVGSFTISPDSATIVLSAEDEGFTKLFQMPAAGGTPAKLFEVTRRAKCV